MSSVFLRSAVDFWLTYYHFDGVRYDAVANLIYRNGNTNDAVNESGIWFLKTCNYAIQKRHPNVMLIAEDSSNYLKVTAPVEYGGLGFDYKWDLGWMNDTLDYLSVPPRAASGRAYKNQLLYELFLQRHLSIAVLPR